ncbi:IclR family transcriptional regulator [Salinadaptatus halalkaliphilus]|uniref:IclR family transcriptional regulator n=1 Tax=Salinadaptatus halalkaliphilus TaxID=2419781 RepID=A0A4V3VL83_9EURY|nr:IclR family transcriptional regulator [Salinadaptatus halalkaliphilus]THE64547.1 IclR family transcriptional regulator [Salinadaptatus halalkaliphilus]
MAKRVSDDRRVESTTPRIQSVERSLEIIEELKRQDGAGVSELASAIGVSKGTAHKHLVTLLEHDYVRKDDGSYHIGPQFLDVGGYALHQFRGISHIEPKIRELAELTGETVQFSTESRGRSIVLKREVGTQGVCSRARLGKRFYMHQIAGGKAVLANVPERRVREIIDRHGLPAATESTITNESRLFDELEAIRSRGYAFNRDESTDGLHAVGVPLTGPDGNVLGAFAVAGPSHRMRGEWFEDEIPDFMQSAVNELELNLTYS